MTLLFNWVRYKVREIVSEPNFCYTINCGLQKAKYPKQPNLKHKHFSLKSFSEKMEKWLLRWTSVPMCLNARNSPVNPQASASRKVLQDIKKKRAVSSRGKQCNLVNFVTLSHLLRDQKENLWLLCSQYKSKKLLVHFHVLTSHACWKTKHFWYWKMQIRIYQGKFQTQLATTSFGYFCCISITKCGLTS